MDDKELTLDVTISPKLIDRIAGLMVILQRQDPVDLLQLGQLLDRLQDLYRTSFGQWLRDRRVMHQLAGEILTELQAIRGPWVVCHLCSPPRRMEMKLIRNHDIEVHHAYKG